MSKKTKEDQKREKWVWAACTCASCRGLIKYGEPFKVFVLEGTEKQAICNECFSK